MPQRNKGTRLWLQPGRPGRNERAVWVIRDRGRKISTGFGASDGERAEKALADYIIAKTAAPRTRNRHPDQVRIADVITIYAQDVAPRHAKPHGTAARLARLLDFFGDMTLGGLNRRTCAAYVTQRGPVPAARRELEDLRAAVRYHWQSGLCSGLSPVTLPDKSLPRERWLTRSEAARLLWAAWRARHERSDVRPRLQHVARFVLIGLYTGTRASAICGAALAPTEGRGWIDLDQGVFYRRAQGRKETKKRQPPVRLPPRLLTHLRRWQRLGLANRSAVEYEGRPIVTINHGFRIACEAAGLADVTPHTLRHTCATWLAQRGVPVWEAAGYLGMTAQTFEATYGHHHPDHQAQAVAAFTRQSRAGEDRRVVNMWKGR
jgi:integrase